MAPKYVKSKKVSKALEVSTLHISKSQKRKSKEDFSKDKGKRKKNKKGESTSTSTLEWNELYFNEDKAQERYDIDFFLESL